MKKIILIFTCTIILLKSSFSYAENFTHVEQLFDLRTAIINQGKTLPDHIKKITGTDRRTLERIFEMNNSTLTTIEAYFRILKIAVLSGNTSDPAVASILNEWLNFIKNQCAYDSEYLSASRKETDNKSIIQQINRSQKNTKRLSKITDNGITENEERVLE